MPQQQAEYMTCTPLRINAKFLLHRGRRPYMSLSKDAPHALSCLAFDQLFAGWRVCQACAARPFFYE
jgi:hypothetical protein